MIGPVKNNETTQTAAITARHGEAKRMKFHVCTGISISQNFATFIISHQKQFGGNGSQINKSGANSFREHWQCHDARGSSVFAGTDADDLKPGGGYVTAHSAPQEAYGELGFRWLEEAAGDTYRDAARD